MATEGKGLFTAVKEIICQTVLLYIQHKKLILCMAITAVFDLFALAFVYYFSNPVIGKILIPIIIRFAGTKFLHYPLNFHVLPKLFYYLHMFVGLTVGVLISGWVIRQIGTLLCQKREELAVVEFVFTLKRYFKLMAIWIITYVLMAGVQSLLALRFFSFLFPVMQWVALVVAILVQALFVYAPVAVLVSEKGFFKALWQGMKFLKRNFLVTVILLSIPLVPYVPIMIAENHLGFFVNTLLPESVLGLMVVKIIVFLLIELWIAGAVTVLYVSREKKELL